MKRTVLLVLACIFANQAFLHAEVSDSLKAIQSVGLEGKGNVEAAQAWQELVETGPVIILPALQAMNDSSPLARNWLRSAIETVVDDAEESKTPLPTGEVREFLLDRSGDPSARTLAYQLYASIDSKAATELIPGMIDDPSPGLRREAVGRLITRGKSLLAEENKEESITVLREALEAAREVGQIEQIAKTLRTDLEQAVDLPHQFGFLLYWKILGPFDNTDRAGFDAVFPPEASIDLEATFTGKDDKKISWEDYSTADDYGMVDFNQPYGPLKQVVGYAFTEFTSEKEQEVELRLGCKNAWKIWLNGELVFGRDEYHRGIRIDQYILPVTMKEGKNTILVKACQNEQEQDWTVQWQFQLRVCDSSGAAVYSTNRKPTPEPTAKPRRRSAE